MHIEGKVCWLNHIDAALEKYNTRLHSTVLKPPHLQVGDYVRIHDKRNLLSKHSTTKWSRELFRIEKQIQLTQ